MRLGQVKTQVHNQPCTPAGPLRRAPTTGRYTGTLYTKENRCTTIILRRLNYASYRIRAEQYEHH